MDGRWTVGWTEGGRWDGGWVVKNERFTVSNVQEEMCPPFFLVT
jgi:hypothetical protein